jgi:hypothetical protein
MELDRFLDDSRSPGTHISEGSFTLNADRARKKLEQYQLDEPRKYLLKLVQAAVASHTDKIAVTRNRFSTSLRFKVNRTESIGDINQVLGRLRGEGKSPSPALEHLMVAFSACCNTEHKAVEFHIASSVAAYTLQISPSFAVVEKKPKKSLSENEILCTFERTEPGGFARLLFGANDRAWDHTLLHEFCGFSPVQILLDGANIGKPWSVRRGKTDEGHWLQNYQGQELNLVEQYHRSTELHFAQSVNRSLYSVQETEFIWRTALTLVAEDVLPYHWGLTSFVLQVLEDGEFLSFDRVLHRIAASYGCALCLAFQDETCIQPVYHGVCLEPIKRKLGMPGLHLIGYWNGMQTDLTGLAVIEDDNFDRFLDVQNVNYARLLKEAVRFKKIYKPVPQSIEENRWQVKELWRILKRLGTQIRSGGTTRQIDILDPTHQIRSVYDRGKLYRNLNSLWQRNKENLVNGFLSSALAESTRAIKIVGDRTSFSMSFEVGHQSVLSDPGELVRLLHSYDPKGRAVIHFARALFDAYRRSPTSFTYTVQNQDGLYTLDFEPEFRVRFEETTVRSFAKCEIALELPPHSYLPLAWEKEVSDTAYHTRNAVILNGKRLSRKTL